MTHVFHRCKDGKFRVPKMCRNKRLYRWKCHHICCMKMFSCYISKNLKSAIIGMHRSLAKQDKFIEKLTYSSLGNHIPCAWLSLCIQYLTVQEVLLRNPEDPDSPSPDPVIAF